MIDDIHFNLSLIRHGQSEVNILPDVIGQSSDTPLTKHGKRQARALGNRFVMTGEYFDYIYSSDYVRAFDTAYISKGESSQSIIIDEDLREYDAGDWLSCSRSKIMTDNIRFKMAYLDNTFLPPNGESLNQVERRASRWLEDNIIYNKEFMDFCQWKIDNDHPPLNIAVFTHGMTIKTLLHYIMGFDKSFTWKINIDNTSVTKLSFSKIGWRLQYLNDASHLLMR